MKRSLSSRNEYYKIYDTLDECRAGWGRKRRRMRQYCICLMFHLNLDLYAMIAITPSHHTLTTLIEMVQAITSNVKHTATKHVSFNLAH